MIPPLPTGQTDCFDDHGQVLDCSAPETEDRFPGQAAQGDARETGQTRFLVNDEEVLDRLTGLIWCRSAALSEFPESRTEAQRLADGLGSGWRLPDRRELLSLVSFATNNPSLPPDHPFADVFSGWYWTATPAASNPGFFWRVQMVGGRMFPADPSTPCMAWAVRGESEVLAATGADEPRTGVPWPEPRFTDLDGAVRDELTGLAWAHPRDLGDPCLWGEALRRARDLDRVRPAGLTGWRTPTILELESLADGSKAYPALPAGHPFLGLRGDREDVFWSSTTSGLEPDWAMCGYLDRGAVGVGFKTGPQRLRAWAVCRTD